MALAILKIIGCELEYYAVNCAPSFGEDPTRLYKNILVGRVGLEPTTR